MPEPERSVTATAPIRPQATQPFFPAVNQPRPRLRIPILETTAMQFGGAFAQSSRPLNEAQRAAASFVFGSSVNLNAVRLVETNIISAPTTLGNNIRIPPGQGLTMETFIHEMGHIWQYQNRGGAYISDSAVSQIAATIATGDRNAAYRTDIIPGQSIYRYSAEQQATIIERWYTNPELRTDPDYSRMIGEVRAARPTMTDMDRYQESLYGNTGHDRRFDAPNPHGDMLRPDQVVPLIRLEF